MFQRTCGLDWPAVQAVATTTFLPVLERKWPRYLREMEGIAQGAGVSIADIVALNVRTEIAFGMFKDGCTSLAWRRDGGAGFSYLAQNWDWLEAQKPNLVRLTIKSQSSASSSSKEKKTLPTISILTEAGLIGKIGFNSHGVGVVFNAIRAAGVDSERIPAHLGLRLALECESAREAFVTLTSEEVGGVATSCYMGISDDSGGEAVGIEWNSRGWNVVESTNSGRGAVGGGGTKVYHTNHFLRKPEGGVVDTVWLKDSLTRQQRIGELCEELELRLERPTNGAEEQVNGHDAESVSREPTVEEIRALFADRQNAPKSISRDAIGTEDSATLFNVVMDLKRKTGYFRVGRMSEAAEEEFVVQL